MFVPGADGKRDGRVSVPTCKHTDKRDYTAAAVQGQLGAVIRGRLGTVLRVQ